MSSEPSSAHRDAPSSSTEPRRSRPTRVLVALALAFATALAAGPAMADARTEARRHFRAGMELISKGNYPEGIKELERAQEILPHPNVLFNIARAHAEAGNLEQAITAYKQYVASDPPDRAEAAQVLKQLEEKLALQRAEQAKNTEPPKTNEGDTKPGDTKPGDTTPGDTKPGDTKPSDTKPGDTKPGDTTPSDTKPGDTKPGDAKAQADVNKIVGKARDEDVYRETVITASRGAQSPLDSPNSTTIITRQDIRLSGITRIPELLRRVPGMDVMQITGGDTNVSMRGFNSRLANKLLVLINGQRPAYLDILGSTFWETLSIDVDQIERIEVVRGPGSALYGANAFAGVVNIITIAPGEGRTGFRVGYGDTGQGYGSAWATGRDGDFGYRASVGYTRYSRWTREVQDGRQDVVVFDPNQNLGAENLRVDIRLSQRFKNNRELQIGGGFARSDIDVYGIGPFNDYRARFDNSDITALFKTENFSARVFYARVAAQTSSNHDYYGHTLFPSQANQNVVDAELNFFKDVTWPKSVDHSLRAGAAYRLKSITWTYLQDDTPIENWGSLFLQDTLRFGKKVQLVVSGRADYVPYLETVKVSPRGSLIIKPTDLQSIRVSGSTAFRNTTFLESYLDLPIQLQLPGVELISASKRYEDTSFRLRPESIITAEASYLNQMSDRFEFEATAYYNRISDLIALAGERPLTLANRADGLGGLNPETGRYTVGFGGWLNRCDIQNVFGGEVGTRVYPIEGLDLFANYALNLSSQELPDGCSAPTDQRTSRHKINVGVQLRTKPGIDGEITFHYQSAQTWAEQVATLSGIQVQTFDVPGYALLNGRIGWRFPIASTTGEVSLVVYNALAGVAEDPPQMHPFGNRVGRRIMGFFQHTL
ncbi:TonB-dependent receptor [Polyangium sp. y55x31]|uniref:TonB-dependent receptor domain-containing protein n=1 Tax=Polyangium sp. y55x31 TaxID=3042688 RepID=UPI002482AD0F|nr:TonB-dependent receptor [Polyangium sp. y55x31]MDI1475556.1 TonB-dependent receptor plug domain-containing protein [Polyangium sp. y55x31]